LRVRPEPPVNGNGIPHGLACIAPLSTALMKASLHAMAETADRGMSLIDCPASQC